MCLVKIQTKTNSTFNFRSKFNYIGITAWKSIITYLEILKLDISKFRKTLKGLSINGTSILLTWRVFQRFFSSMSKFPASHQRWVVERSRCAHSFFILVIYAYFFFCVYYCFRVYMCLCMYNFISLNMFYLILFI